ncbi:MAG TPA: hypothetical protein VMM56_16290 [Planctomycetaceae bacterium]|nr:hypothetical protein [Planctomycetaceae bacterium]
MRPAGCRRHRVGLGRGDSSRPDGCEADRAGQRHDWLGAQYTAEAVCALDEKIADNVEWVRKLTLDDVPTESGRFHEAAVEVSVVDGKLTIELDKQDRIQNTCLNWVKVEKLKQ